MSQRIRKIIGTTLWWVHFILVLFVIVAPFVPYPKMILADIFLIPLIKLHWMTNSNQCWLTTISDDLLSMDKPKSDAGFIGELIKTFFKVSLSTKKAEQITHCIMLGLWIVCLYNYGSRV